jgi:hypothetical protein
MLFEKIKLNVNNKKVRLIRICNKSVLQYEKDAGGKKHYTLPFIPKIQNNKNPLFYLKVNQDDEDSLICIQYWINIIAEMHADYIIICDNKSLERKILKKIFFPNSNIKFIKSTRKSFLPILKKQKLQKKWYKAACAHLTTYIHAKKNNIKHFWNIDADDALFLVEPKKAVTILQTAQDYANENQLDDFSFDFWATKCRGRHWSFGITYTRNSADYIKLLQENIITWDNYKRWTTVHNLDWLFSFLKDSGKLNLKSFYVENMYFIHWGRFIGDMKNAYITTWKNNQMYYPILKDIFKDKRGILPVVSEDIVHKFELGVSEDECLDFAMKYLYKSPRDCIR